MVITKTAAYKSYSILGDQTTLLGSTENCILDCVNWVNVTNLVVILTTVVVIPAVKQ